MIQRASSNHPFLTEKTMHKWEFFAELHCLNLGILGPSVIDSKEKGSIDTALSLLSPGDRRKATRKARKLMRKRLKKHWKDKRPGYRRSSLSSQMIYEAWKIHSRDIAAIVDDNDV